MKNRILYILAICLAATSCHPEDNPHQPKDTRCNTIIADFLYGVEYDDYDFDACKAYFDKQYIPSGACSEVRRGNFIGRNLDWYINNNASAIIKMNHNANHYASIGVVGCFPQFNNDMAKTGEYSEIYQYLPFKTEDGINECGLYVGINVMPTGETSFDPDSWTPHKYGKGATHTNPNAALTCSVNYLPRILLDKCASVVEAKKLISMIDWTEPMDYPHAGETQSFHWLISDATTSVVLEFMDNKAVYTEATDIKKPGFGTIMTNFTNCLWEKGIFQINGIGYERYDVLRDNYEDFNNFPDTAEGMEKLMKQAWFSKTYTTSLDSHDVWLSEFSNDDITAEMLYHSYFILDIPEIKEYIQEKLDDFNDKSLWYTDKCTFWFSTHTSVYDIAARKLHLLVHEDYGDMKEFYEANLDSHFAKPLNAR